MKTHLSRGGNFPFTELASCNHNTKSADGFVPLGCLGPKAFRETPAEFRCKHCEKAYLQRRNRKRRKEGKAPVKIWNEGF